MNVTAILFVCALLLAAASLASPTLAKPLEKATFAGGCFWCMEKPFEQLEGVADVVSGYTGGHVSNPSYHDVSAGKTGHYEAIEITFDPERISYETLLDVFWRQVNPTDEGGQFVDRGGQYGTAIFVHSPRQKEAALESRRRLDASGRYGKPVVTPILDAGPFYPAEEYHQDYYKKNPIRYKLYRLHSGRDQHLEKIWKNDPPAATGKYSRPGDDAIRRMLTPLQYEVTQKNGTERPFANEFWDNKKPGIYVDVVSGEPLFSSLDKYDSKTGWPSFFRPLEPANIVEKKDKSLFTTRTEVRSLHGDSHLGHVFDDGPQPTGLRYCINSAALRFVPVQDMEKDGYGQYLPAFKAIDE